MNEPTVVTWPEFHIAIISKDGTLFPSFPSKQLSDGDADKITLSQIRKFAAISGKLRFTADSQTLIDDETTLSYYMSLRGEDVKKHNDQASVIDQKQGSIDPAEQKNQGQDEAQADNKTQGVKAEPDGDKAKPDGDKAKLPGTLTIKVDLILSSADSSMANRGSQGPSLADTVKFQEGIDKMISNMKGEGAVKVGDLAKLSSTLGALTSDNMSFAATAGTTSYPEPLDLTEQQWDKVLRNNRALHGWYSHGNVLFKARKRAFDLKPTVVNQSEEPGVPEATLTGEATEKTKSEIVLVKKIRSLPPIPPFYVFDDSSVEVTEMTSALEKQMAEQGFSSLAVKAAAGGGAMGAQATGSLAVEKEHSEAYKEIQASQVNSVHVSYKFPRVAVELDSYCLKLTDECKKQALEARNRSDTDKWERDYGNVFATLFTLGGELTSSRVFQSKDGGDLSAFKDSVKIAAGLSISSPVASGGGSIASSNSKEVSQEGRTADRSMRLAWQARGGDTLLCSNPPLWASTVKNYHLWRIMDQQGMVRMMDFVHTIHPQAGQQLQNPVTGSKLGPATGGDAAGVWTLLTKALRYPNEYPVAGIVKGFYESKDFDIREFNSLFGEDGQELKLSSKISWGELDLEQKQYVGQMCYKRKLIFQD